jgi:hypothetical protein
MAMVARFIVRTGADTFDVIEGRKLNVAPLSRSVADRLASAAERPPVRAIAPAATAGPPAPASALEPAPEPEPAPAPPMPDLRPTRADHAGGRCGFRISGWARSW